VNPEFAALSKTVKESGVVDNVKLVTIPFAANKMIVRLENIADAMIQGATT